ncbi:MAG: hypothetical protein H6Q70_1251 [Firmicutes bacterium]|nr:hypothetical protein [Bacillota bacterium]
MSYLSGLAIGLSAGKQLHNIFAGNQSTQSTHKVFRPINTSSIRDNAIALSLIHALPGRRRYTSTILIGNLKLTEELNFKLKTLPSITSVTINPHTGSMLINYTCSETQMDGLIDYLQHKLAHSKNTPVHSEVGLQIRSIFINLDQLIRQFTNNQFDLRSFIASIFITRGLNKVITFKQYPSGPQMLWWAFTLLRGWVVK